MRLLLLALIGVLLAVDGLFHGLWTGRWEGSRVQDAARQRLPSVPLEIGAWQGKENSLPEHHAEMAGFDAYLLRSYEKPDGTRVNVLLGCGSPGKLSVHTPEVCFTGNGFEMASAPERAEPAIKGQAFAPEFWKATYERDDQKVRVFWSWHAGDKWQTPANPRWTFAGQPVLHKLYVTCRMQGTNIARGDKECQDFLEEFLPVLDQKLFAAQP